MSNRYLFQFWLVIRYLRTGGRFLGATTLLAFLGMVIGVASLVLTMAVISGFETALKDSVIDVSGHLLLVKSGGGVDNPKEVVEKIKKLTPDLVAYTPFVHVEAIAARQGKIQGVVVQGMNPETMNDVLKLGPRVIRGKFDVEEAGGVAQAVAGKVLVEKLGLQVGDEFQVVVPRPSKEREGAFTPSAKKFRLAGVMDLGKYDYDLRFILMRDKEAQQLAGIGNNYSGLKMRLTSAAAAREAGYRISSGLGYPWWTKDWTEVNQNLFEAIKIEKVVIFVVLMFMVIAAAFNISSTLFISVMKKYGDISVFKTMGASPSFLVQLFSMQGLFIGFFGSLFGVILGIALCYVFVHSPLFQIPGEVYRLDHLPVELRPGDLFATLAASFLTCFIATLAPALRGARLKPVEGLRYE